jgi:hypothetical protein
MGRMMPDAKLPATTLRTAVMMRSNWIYLLLLAAGSVWGAQVYRIVDADGNVSYSDRPDSQNVERIFIDTSIATPAATNPATADIAPPEEGVTGEFNTEVDEEPSAEEIAAVRTENCGTARERQERFSIAHRIYRNTEDGEREYLNDEEFDALLAQAAADVETWCD